MLSYHVGKLSCSFAGAFGTAVRAVPRLVEPEPLEQALLLQVRQEQHPPAESLVSGDFSIDEWKMLCAFVEWHREYKPDIEALELPVYDLEKGYAGRIDAVCFIQGVRYLVDFKTSSAIHNAYWLQVNAYAYAYERLYELTVDRIAILRLGTKHKCGYEFKEIEPTSRNFEVFLACKTIWHSENGESVPVVESLPDTLFLS
jgi:hypothetical protein